MKTYPDIKDQVQVAANLVAKADKIHLKEIKSKPKAEFVFQSKDENYFIKYKNEEFELRITKGLEYIQYLLKNPHPKKFTPKRLHGEVKKAPRLPDKSEKDAIDESYCEDEDLTIESQGEHADIVDEETKDKGF